MELEAPSNYRAHRTLALYLDRQGRVDDAAIEYRRSIALWGGDPKVYENLAILLDRKGNDTAAVGGTAGRPGSGRCMRPRCAASCYYLQAAQGDWRAAPATAEGGVSSGRHDVRALVHRADSALSGPGP